MLGNYSRPEFKYLANAEWHGTEKVDGMNVRVTFGDDGGVVFAGKTDRAVMPTKLLSYLSEKFSTPKGSLPPGTILYGEGFGAGIQRGGMYGEQQRFCLFDVLLNGRWLPRDEVEGIATMYGVPFAPVVFTGSLADLVDTVRTGFVSPFCVTNPGLSEGLVARPAVELKDAHGARIITKLKHRDFNNTENS